MLKNPTISVSLTSDVRQTAQVTLTPTLTLSALIGELKARFKLNASSSSPLDVLVRNAATGASIGWLSESSVSPFETHTGCLDENIDPRYEFGSHPDHADARQSATKDADDSDSTGSDDDSDDDDDDDDDDESDDDDDTVTDIDELRSRLRKARAHVKEATVTIAALVEQFTSYKSEVELSHGRLTEHLGRTEDRAKLEREETIANLQTLMNELELIEQKNLELNDELQTERHEHHATIEELEALRRAAGTAATTTTATATISANGSDTKSPSPPTTPRRSGGGSFIRPAATAGARSPAQTLQDVAVLVRQMSAMLADVDVSAVPGGVVPASPAALSSTSSSAAPLDKSELGVSSQSVSRIRQTISRLQTPAKTVSKRASARTDKLMSPRRTSSVSHAVTLPAVGKTAVLCAVVVGDAIWLSLADCSLVVVNRATCAPTKTLPRRDLDAHASPISLMRAYGDSVWAATSDGNVLQLDAASGALRASWRAHPKKIADLVVVEDLSAADSSYHLWTCCSADMLLKTWSSSGALLHEQRLPNLMLCFLVHAGLLWLGTESSILRFNIQTFRRLDTLRRLDGESLRSANQLLSVGDDVFAVCDDGVIAQFAVHGECLRHIQTGRLTAVGVVGDHLWLGGSGSIRLLSRNAEWLGADLRFPPGVDAVLAILPVDATIASPDGPVHAVAVTVTIDAQLVAWTAPAPSELTAQVAEVPRATKVWQRDDAAAVKKASTSGAASSPVVAARGGGGAKTATAPSALDDDLGDLLQLMAKNRSHLTVVKKEEQRKVAVTSGRELLNWFENFVTGVGSHAEAVEFGKRLQAAGRLQPVEGDDDIEFGADETLWSLDLRSHKGSVLKRLFRKRKTSPGIAALQQQQDDLKRSQSKRAAMPPQANKSSLTAVFAASVRADDDDNDAGSSNTSSSSLLGAPTAAPAVVSSPAPADDEKKRVKSRAKWHHKLRVFLERASSDATDVDGDDDESTPSSTVTVRESMTVSEVKRALLAEFQLASASPDDYALVSVVENRMCVCQLINPLRHSLKLKRADERFELWRVPADDGQYEAWDDVGVPRAGDADDAQHAQLREDAHYGQRPTTRPLIAPTHVVVLHEYKAAADDEVSLRKGDIVRLYMRGADADWWHGEIVLREKTEAEEEEETSDQDQQQQQQQKRIGLFPSSFTNGVAKKPSQTPREK
jgi:hypothetical protein